MPDYSPSSNAVTIQPDSAKRGRLSMRFRNINILLFVITLCLIAAVMSTAIGTVADNITSRYASSYTVSTAEALSSHLDREIGLMSKAAHSEAVVTWLSDEFNASKKASAYEELLEIVVELYSFNLYVVSNKSLNEYQFLSGDTPETIQTLPSLDRSDPVNEWYFNCIEANEAYSLSVDIDHEMQRKRVWLDYKVVHNGVTLGVISTGLEFSHVVKELFSHNDNARGLIIDETGLIHMDSSQIDNRDFMYGNFTKSIEDEFSDKRVLESINSHLEKIDGYAEQIGEPSNTKLSNNGYLYMNIAPIRATKWSVVILAGDSSLLNVRMFLPVAAASILLLILFAAAISAANYRLIFKPLEKLDNSLKLLSGTNSKGIYGVERDDELGHLSQTIQELFEKANIDALTGIYNRRFMESNLEQIIGFLSRSEGILSVLMLDIDFFKRFNDTYGHDQGDVCLRAVAQSLAGGLKRVSDFVARYGGEEFIAILPNTDESGAHLIAEKFLTSVRELNIPHEHNDAAPYVTVSIGVTTGKVEFGQNWENYVKRADKALYASKQTGRNRYTYYSFSETSIKDQDG